MHALVLIDGRLEPIHVAGSLAASGLGCRALRFDRRPHLGLYDMVVLALSDVGLIDPAVPLLLASGQLRGKTVAFLTDSLLPRAMDAYMAPLTAAALIGGVRIHPESLHLSSGIFLRLGAEESRRARAWGEQLKSAYPPPTFPRGPAGRRSTGL